MTSSGTPFVTGAAGAAGATGATGAAGPSVYPSHIFVPAAAEPVATSGDWSSIRYTSDLVVFARNQVGPANGNWIAWDVVLAAGTWQLDNLFLVDNDSGKVQTSVNAVNVGSLTDLYAASADAIKQTVSGIVVAATALLRVKLTVNGKNASSSGYLARFQSFSMTKTA